MGSGTHHRHYFAALEDICSSAEQQLHALVPHMGEQGRLLEEVLRGVLSRTLPKRFSLGTGILINSMGGTSSQTDVVIYDSLQNSPLLTEFSSLLFPIECVFAGVEVKKAFVGIQCKKLAADIAKVRRLAKRKTYVQYSTQETAPGKLVAARQQLVSALPPRAFVFCFSTKLKSIRTVERNLVEGFADSGAHLHGLYILREKWLLWQKPHEQGVVLTARENVPLAEFLMLIMAGVSSMDVGAMDLQPYLK